MRNVTRTAAVVAAVVVGAIVFASVATASDGHHNGREHHRRGAELRFAHAFKYEHHVHSSVGSTSTAVPPPPVATVPEGHLAAASVAWMTPVLPVTFAKDEAW